MKPLLLLCCLLPVAAYAQPSVPVTAALWGQTSEKVEQAVLRVPGFRWVSAEKHGEVTLVSYDHIDAGDEALIYHFRHDSLLAVSRMVIRKREADIAPAADWKPLGENQWIVKSANTWLRRYYDGEFVRDEMLPIKQR